MSESENWIWSLDTKSHLVAILPYKSETYGRFYAWTAYEPTMCLVLCVYTQYTFVCFTICDSDSSRT